jgi:hypothetical protein
MFDPNQMRPSGLIDGVDTTGAPTLNVHFTV